MMTLTRPTMRAKKMTTSEYKEVGIDIETYSGKDIDAGVYAYAEDPDFEILLVAYTVDGSEVKCFMPSAFKDENEQMRLFEDDIEYDGSEDEFIELLRDPAVTKTAYNANFERTCLAKYYGVECPPEEWRCTAVLAATVGLPRSLKDVGEALGLPSDQQKLATGKRLIDYFCKPCKPTKSNGNRCRNMPHHDPAKWKLFAEYNKQDVVSEQAILNKLRKYRPNDTEQALWATDQRINDRGIRIDVPFVEGILENDHKRTDALIEEARELTGLENPNSPTQLKAWFRANGAASLGDTLDKDTIAWALKSDLYPERIKKVLRIRQSLGKISIKKYEAMINSVCEDGRVRGMTRFYGANRTGRWSGQIVQLQNLPQNHIEDLDLARRLVADRDFDTLELLFGDTAQVLSELVRTAFIPADGCKFIVTDFSAIEARVIAWVAGEDWRLKVFKDGGDIYCESASKMFKVPVVKHGINGHLRQQGKVAELALGYGGGEGAIKSMDKGGVIPPKDIPGIISSWRSASPNIVRMWSKYEKAAAYVIENHEKVKVGKVQLRYMGGNLFIKLPSGRSICYYGAKLSDVNGWGKRDIEYHGVNQTTRKWETTKTYGGKLTENVIQAIARDCLAVKLMEAERRGYKVVAHVHDEMIIEAPKDLDMNEVDALMAEPIEWAEGLPLIGGTYECEYYKKD